MEAEHHWSERGGIISIYAGHTHLFDLTPSRAFDAMDYRASQRYFAKIAENICMLLNEIDKINREKDRIKSRSAAG